MNVTINLQLPDVLVRLIESALSGDAAAPLPPSAFQAGSPAPQAPVAPPAAAAAEAPGKPKTARAPKAAPAPTEPTAQAAAVGAPEPKVEPSAPAAAAPAPSYDDVKAVLISMTSTHGRDAVVDLLARYGVKRAPDLKPETYADLLAEAAQMRAAS